MALAPSLHPSPRVTIIGAGNVGSNLAQRIAEKNLADVVLLDVVAGRPQGIALDLMEARGVERHDRQILGTSDYADTQDSDVVVITAGSARKPGMSREDLLKTNAQVVAAVTRQAIAVSPDAVVLVVTNPLDVMTYLAWQVSSLPPQRVMGMAGVLDSARFQTFIALELGVSITDISAMVLGGHGDLMVPLPRYSTVSGVPITELMDEAQIARLVKRTREGGAEIVKLMQTGSAYAAPAAAACLMVEAILLNRFRIVPAAAYLQGEYGLSNIFMGVPVCLQRSGIASILELSLSEAEQTALQRSAESIRQSLDQIQDLLSSGS